MTGRELKTLVPVWSKQIGVDEAKKKLVMADVKFSTAEALIRGSYNAVPKEELSDKLRLAMRDYLAELEAS